ncbi:MAG TPA: hypothetical protein VKT75_12005 [Acidobacteriaceae bacterium]|nr:hypothetical protein [Acidobacteriaceae bacterium]
MRALNIAVIAVPLFLLSGLPSGQGQTSETISATEASAHVGEHVTVCGRVAAKYTASTSPGTPTFVSLDRSGQDQVFTILIWRDDRSRVGHVPESGKVCATGTITAYRGTPEIVLRDSHSWFVPR